MPFIIRALFVFLLHRCPGDAVGGFFAAGVAFAVTGAFVFVVGAIEGFTVDGLSVVG